MPKETSIFKTFKETEDSLPDKSKVDLLKSLKAELLTTMRAEVKSAVRLAKREILQTTVEDTIKDIFLDDRQSADEGVQDSCYQFMKFFLTHLVAGDMMNSIVALNFDKWSRSDPFMNEIAYRIASIRKLLISSMIREPDRGADIARSDRPSNCHDLHSSMSQSRRKPSNSESDSPDKKGRARRFHLKI